MRNESIRDTSRAASCSRWAREVSPAPCWKHGGSALGSAWSMGAGIVAGAAAAPAARSVAADAARGRRGGAGRAAPCVWVVCASAGAVAKKRAQARASATIRRAGPPADKHRARSSDSGHASSASKRAKRASRSGFSTQLEKSTPWSASVAFSSRTVPAAVCTGPVAVPAQLCSWCTFEVVACGLASELRRPTSVGVRAGMLRLESC